MKVLPAWLAASLALVLSAPLAAPALAQSSDPVPMAPASPWTVDYAKDSCALIRSFASGSDQMILEMRAFGPGGKTGVKFQVKLASATIPLWGKSVRVRFDPDEDYYRPSDISYLSGDDLRAVDYADWLRASALKQSTEELPDWSEAERDAREAAITGLTVVGLAPHNLTLQTGPMDQPMAALRTCLDDLLKRAGIDPAVQRSLSREAEPIDQMKWVRRASRDLPTRISNKAHSGIAHLRVIVSADGKPVSCKALQPSMGPPEFGDYSCKVIMQHARFEPALDADGHPVQSVSFADTTYKVG